MGSFFSENVSKQANANSSSNQGGYLNVSKLEDGGAFKISILSDNPAEFWECWGEAADGQKKPFRFIDQPSQEDIDVTLGDYKQRLNYEGTKLEAPKFVVAFFAFDWADEKVKVMSIPQKTVYNELFRLSMDEDFGDIHSYELKFSRSGVKMATEYRVTPVTRKPGADEKLAAAKAMMESNGYDLKELIVGGNPFGA